MGRVKLGDVFEIETSVGMAYFQVTYNHREPPKYGYLIRVLKELNITEDIICEKTQNEERFFVFFPVGAALNRKIIRKICNCPIPQHANSFPVLRIPGNIALGGKVLDWRIWDGQKRYRIESLSDEQKRLSLGEIWNDTMLIRRIETGWKPEDIV